MNPTAFYLPESAIEKLAVLPGETMTEKFANALLRSNEIDADLFCEKKKVAYRLTAEQKDMIDDLSRRTGLSKNQTVALLIEHAYALNSRTNPKLDNI